MKPLTFIINSLFILSLIGLSQEQRTDVDIYYESLDPASKTFFVEQLCPFTGSPLFKCVNIQLIPFGKATYTKTDCGYNFTCTRGPAECLGNKIHACAIREIQDEVIRIKFLACLMAKATREGEIPGRCCADELKISYDCIENCVATSGDQLLAEHGDKTCRLRPPIQCTPEIVFNGKPDPKLRALALKNFKEAVCSQLPCPKPDECKNCSVEGNM